MRGVFFVTLMLAAAGCAKREVAQPSVHVAPIDPVASPVPPLTKQPQSLLRLDFVTLWEKTGPPRLSPEEQEQLFHGRVVYSDHPDEFFAMQLLASCLADPVTVAARYKVQPDVVRRVWTSAQEPPSIKPTGGLLAIGEHAGKRTTVIAVVEQPGEARERFLVFVEQGVNPAIANATGTDVRSEPLPGVPSGVVIPFATPERTGTITLALIPHTEKKTLETLIASEDILGRSLLMGRREGDTLLIAIVEER